MNSKEYQADATVTDLMDYGPVLERLQNIHTVRLLHAAMGLCTEAGEFMDMLKKHILYGKPLDEVNLNEELGDKLWYTALALDELKTTFDQCMETNIKKLRQRYPNKFTEADALNRDLNKERQILESTKVTRVWNAAFGYWKYSCGCVQMQDGYDLCDRHKPSGYPSLIRDLVEEPRTAKGSLD